MSNLTICNLAYSGKLQELKEEILADKSLATRTDQVKQRWGLFSGGSDDVETNVAAWRGPSGGRFPEGQIPAPVAPSSPWVTSGLRIGRLELVLQSSDLFYFILFYF